MRKISEILKMRKISEVLCVAAILAMSIALQGYAHSAVRIEVTRSGLQIVSNICAADENKYTQWVKQMLHPHLRKT